LEKIIQAILLGAIQGITEFLPISSSAHLKLFAWLFDFKDIPEYFDLALHIGTILALVIFFIKDWIKLITSGFKIVFKKEESKSEKETTFYGKLFWTIVLVTGIAGVLSLILEKVSEKLINNDKNLEFLIIAIMLILLGIVLYFVDKKCKSEKSFEDLKFKDVMLIGLSQALAAAFPGTSRSGITMTCSRGLKIDRENSVKISFLLAAPIVAGASAYTLLKEILAGTLNLEQYGMMLFAGIITSFIIGMLSIKLMMNYIKNKDLSIFAIWRIIVGIVIIFAINFK